MMEFFFSLVEGFKKGSIASSVKLRKFFRTDFNTTITNTFVNITIISLFEMLSIFSSFSSISPITLQQVALWGPTT